MFEHEFAIVFTAVVCGFCAGWAVSLLFRAGMLAWMFHVKKSLWTLHERIAAMTTTSDQFATDLSNLASAVTDIGTAIETEAANFQAQIDAIKQQGTGPSPDQLAALETSIANLKTISAKAKTTGLPPTAPAPSTGDSNGTVAAPAPTV